MRFYFWFNYISICFSFFCLDIYPVGNGRLLFWSVKPENVESTLISSWLMSNWHRWAIQEFLSIFGRVVIKEPLCILTVWYAHRYTVNAKCSGNIDCCMILISFWSASLRLWRCEHVYSREGKQAPETYYFPEMSFCFCIIWEWFCLSAKMYYNFVFIFCFLFFKCKTNFVLLIFNIWDLE